MRPGKSFRNLYGGNPGLGRRRGQAEMRRRPKWKRRELFREPWKLPMITFALASTEIQKMMRGYLVRQLRYHVFGRTPKTPSMSAQLKKLKLAGLSRLYVYHVAAISIQEGWKAYKLRWSHGGKELVPGQVAAKRIQRAWRSYVDVRVFRYYASLLRFKSQGDPTMLLRSISPNEVFYFDKAAQIHVRFRLGGSTFPPNIYYKVFTRGSLCDVGSFAPRNYVCTKPLGSPGQRNNKCKGHGADHICRFCVECSPNLAHTIRVGCSEFEAKFSEDSLKEYLNGADGWYERKENNGWRLVTAPTLSSAQDDPISRASNSKTIKYHHSKLRRREDRERMRKLRRRQWMKHLYTQGLACSEADAKEEKNDVDVNDLIVWAQDLDYNEYINDWTQLGTSNLVDS